MGQHYGPNNPDATYVAHSYPELTVDRKRCARPT